MSQEQSASYHEQMMAMKASLAVAVILLLLKVWAAYTTGSAALFSDAAESVVHLIAVSIAVWALRLAHKPADEDHQFGHDKVAFISAGFEGAMIMLAALFIYYEAGRDLFSGAELRNLKLGGALSLLAVFMNTALGWVLLKIGKRRNSLVLLANGQHVLADVYTSVAMLVALVLVYLTKWRYWDSIFAFLAATHILIAGLKLVKQSIEGLMDAAQPESEALIRELLSSLAKQHNISFHHLRHRHSGHTHWVEIHIVFPDATSVYDAHELATKAESAVSSLFDSPCRIISHLEPHSLGDKDEEWEGARK